MQFPILDNRPIDQWKVTELKEELRRRKIPTKGLKEELVRKLDEAIRNEKELVNEKETNNGINSDADAQDIGNEEEAEPVAEYTDAAKNKNEKTVEDTNMAEIGDITEGVNEGVKDEDADINHNSSLEGRVSEIVENAVSMENNETGNPSTIAQFISNNKDLRCDAKHEDSEPAIEDATCSMLEPNIQGSMLEPNIQVTEVTPDLESQVMCESISIDSESVKENKTEKLNDENFRVEQEVIKQDMVQQSSVSVPLIAGNVDTLVEDKGPGKDRESLEEIDAKYATTMELSKKDNSVDGCSPAKNQASSEDIDAKYATSVELTKKDDSVDGGSLGKDQASLEDIDLKHASNVELSKKDDSVDGGSPEKLNLDRSSGDESMEEDVLESTHIESNTKPDGLVEVTEVKKDHAVDERTLVDATSIAFSPDKMDVVAEEKARPTTPIEKRKLEEHDVKTNDSSKRQCRWNSETVNVKVPELKSSNICSSSTPRNVFQPMSKNIFARSDSTLSADSPKERVVPPSKKPATDSLRIDCFLRPFTLKAVQELLAKTGSVCNFWMDHIKTHCYVTYSSIEEAVATRNTVYNLQWPPNGGRKLVAEFVDPQEVKTRVEAPPHSPVPISASPTTPMAPPFQQLQAPKPAHQHLLRQQLPPPPPLPPPPLSDLAHVRERLPPPPPPQKKPEPSLLTLDDLFKKTKTTPRIYYLPLSEEQVTVKLAAQGNHS